MTLTDTVKSLPARRAAAEVAKCVRAIAEKIQVKQIRGKSVSDDEIARRIAHGLDWSLSIPDHNIVAEVSHGYVALARDVDWQYQRAKVVRLIEEVWGGDVTNTIKIRPHASDPEVKRAIISALHRHATIEASKIDIVIVDGMVTLSGDVDASFEKELIENAVWSALST